MGKQNLQQKHNYHKYSCEIAQRGYRLDCPNPHAETKTGVCQVCVHHFFLSLLSLPPLYMSNILILAEILPGFCGQVG